MTDHNDDLQNTSPVPRRVDNQPVTDNRTTPALIEKFVIRLPKGLRTKIKHLSEQNRRSMNSEIIMVLEKHIQQNLADSASDFATDLTADDNHVAERVTANSLHKMSDDELTRRLENLPEEKKQALLELLG